MLEFLAGLTLGLHLGTYHTEPGYNNINPGLYVKTEENVVVGAYYNSERKASMYAGYLLETEGKTFSVIVGAVTGYQRSSVMPLVVPSIRLGSDSLATRLSYLPKAGRDGTHGLHLSLETQF